MISLASFLASYLLQSNIFFSSNTGKCRKPFELWYGCVVIIIVDIHQCRQELGVCALSISSVHHSLLYFEVSVMSATRQRTELMMFPVPDIVENRSPKGYAFSRVVDIIVLPLGVVCTVFSNMYARYPHNPVNDFLFSGFLYQMCTKTCKTA